MVIDPGEAALSLLVDSHRVNWKTLRQSFNDWCRTRSHKAVTELYCIEDDPYVAIRLTYDSTVDRLSLHWIDSAKPINDVAFPLGCNSLTLHIIYRWALQYRGIVVYNAARDTATVHPYQLCAREVTTRSLLAVRLPSNLRQVLPYIELVKFSTQWPFGDREVFGLGTDDGIQLWFFNPTLVPDLADAEPFLAMEESG